MSAVARRRWYHGGFPALRVAEKKIQDVRRRAEAADKQRISQTKRIRSRSRSLSRGRLTRSKSIFFEDSDDDVPYYRSKSVLGGERRDSTFAPVVNEDDVIYQTYTGEELRPNTRLSMKSRAKSRDRRQSRIIHKKVETVVPHRRESYQIDKLQATIFKDIQKTYGESAITANNGFLYDKLAQVKLEHYKMRYLKLKESDKTVLDDKFQQIDRLKHMSRRYEREARQSLKPPQNSYNSIDEKFRRLSLNDQHKTEPKKVNKKRRTNTTPRPMVVVANPIKDKYLPLLDRYEKKKKEKQAAEEPDEIKHLIKVAEQMLSIYDKGAGGKDSKKTKDNTKLKEDADIPTDTAGDTTDSTKGSKPEWSDSSPKPVNTSSTKQVKPGGGHLQRRLSKLRKSKSKLIKSRSSNPSPRLSSYDSVESKSRNGNEADASSTQSKTTSEAQTNGSGDGKTSESSVFTNNSAMRVDVVRKKRPNQVKSRDSSTHSRQVLSRTQLENDKNITPDTKVVFNTHEATETATESDTADKDRLTKTGQNSTIIVQAMSNTDTENRNIHEGKRLSYLERLSNKHSLKNSKPKGIRRSSSGSSTMNTSTNISGYDYAVPMNEYEQISDQRNLPRLNSRSIKRRVSISKKSKKRSTSRERRSSKTLENLSLVDTRQNEVHNLSQADEDGKVSSQRAEIGTKYSEHEEQTEFTVKQSANGKSSTDYSVTTNVHKTVTGEEESESQNIIERRVPPRQGAGRWKDLVQKYIRQPSPKVGHSEHRRMIDTVESDDDDDDFDIFERAKQRYNLNVDSDEDDNESKDSDISKDVNDTTNTDDLY